MVMVAGVIPIMDMVILPMAGVILPMAGVILITDMDPTGQDTIVVTGMDIIMEAEADTIILHLIIPIPKDVATATVTASPGQVIRDTVPGAWILRSRIIPALPVEEAGPEQVLLQPGQQRQVPGQLQRAIVVPL